MSGENHKDLEKELGKLKQEEDRFNKKVAEYKSEIASLTAESERLSQQNKALMEKSDKAFSSSKANPDRDALRRARDEYKKIAAQFARVSELEQKSTRMLSDKRKLVEDVQNSDKTLKEVNSKLDELKASQSRLT